MEVSGIFRWKRLHFNMKFVTMLVSDIEGYCNFKEEITRRIYVGHEEKNVLFGNGIVLYF